MPRRSDFLTSIASCSYPSIAFEYFYEENAPGTPYENLGFFVNEILISLAASGAGVLNLQEGQLIGIASGDPNYSQAITNLLNSEFDNSDITRPHAYLVWMMEACPERSRRGNNMNVDPASSGAVKVQNPNALESVLRNDIPVAKDGYCHVYLSNGSAAYVNFDNFNVARVQGKVRQINDYGSPCACAPAIAYGMAIYGLNGDHDDYLNKYTGKEYQTGEFDPSLSQGLEMFDFGSRFYDAQLGRWHAPDPAEQFSNPYLAMGNNPVSYVDPDGEFIIIPAMIIGAMIGSFTGAVAAGYSGASNGQIMASFGIGALAGALAGSVGQGVTGAIQGAGFWAPVLGQVSVMPVSGFMAGAAVGGASGAAGGFISGFGGEDIKGGYLGQMLQKGLEYRWKGAATGGFVGGAAGGLDALSRNNNFLTGEAGFQKKLAFLMSKSDEHLNEHFNSDLLSTTKIRGWRGNHLKGQFGYTSATSSKSGQSFLGYEGYRAKVHISRSLVKSFYNEYLVDGPATILHEFYHARDFNSGFETFMFREFNQIDARFLAEINAYNFEYSVFQNVNARIGITEYIRNYLEIIK